ncbi:MAG TPA: heavy metal translocating P-type ATPase [Candidatus Limnocylindrales bacterium]|jgi:heavy metal translocating P-type ATPase
MTGNAEGPDAVAPVRRVRHLIDLAMLPMTVAGLLLGLALTVAGNATAADLAWTVPSFIVAVRLAWGIARDLAHGELGVDVIAILAIVGALLLNEPFAAAVIGVMLATGEALERYAQGRAQRELTALLGRAPRVVQRHLEGQLEATPIESVVPGDLLAIKPGEVVPVDGRVAGGPAVLDESALTGESRLVTREDGAPLSSGVVNAGSSFDLLATATAADSAYAGIVRLVEEAQHSKAPFVRLADRYALIFVPFTLAIAGASWLLSGDPTRALAVLVVATPCPLLLAAPIAIVAGISRAARRGVIVKGGGPLETLAGARVMLFDKTGTLTAGRPRLAGIDVDPAIGAVESPTALDRDEVLRLAASVEQLSPHVLAASIVQGARARGLDLSMPGGVAETPGAGVSGVVDGRRVAVGTAEFATGDRALPGWARGVRRRAAIDGSTCAFVRIDDIVVGALTLDDPLRSETPRAIRSLRKIGFTRIVMVTGDNAAVADIIGSAVGVDAVLADRAPSEKVEAVHAERAQASGPIVMVGDGLNDAPALALADVGVAMGARGASASSEAADIVITVDRLDRLTEAVQISRRARSIATQSVVIGMGLSIVAMGAAVVGLLPVVAGAILQEAIDVAVILNALRALRGGVEVPVQLPGWTETNARLREAHRVFEPAIARIRTTADGLDVMSPASAAAALEGIRRFVVDELLPHEELEDRTIYPMLAAAMGSDDATASMHRTHQEIFRLARVLDRQLRDLPADGLAAEDVTDIRRMLYGLEAILRLHQAQEEDLYSSIGDSAAPTESTTAAAAPAQP